MSRAPRHSTPSPIWLGLELAVGVAFLGAAAVAGIAFVHRPGENRLDLLGYQLLPDAPNSHLWQEIARLGSLPALIVGIALAIALAIWRDLWRTAACAIGPLTAVLITEHIAKPLVGRPAVTAGFSYPSGTVTAIAALATVLLLASPPLFRPLAAVVGAGAVAAVAAAVVAMRWHYATDALGGAFVGSGSVFSLDALFHLPALAQARWRERRAEAQLASTQFLERV